MLDTVRINIVWLMALKVTFDLCNAQKGLIECPSCPPGFYRSRNCSEEPSGRIRGVQCSECTDCSATGSVPLRNCSQFSDSLCGREIEPTVRLAPQPDAAGGNWIIATAMGSSFFLILSLVLLTYRNYHSLKCNKPLPLDEKSFLTSEHLPSGKGQNPPENRAHVSDNKRVASEFLV